MPNFGEASVTSILAGRPNMTLILSDIRNHIKAKRGALYVSKSERDNMSRAIVKKYPQMADADGDGTGFVSTSLSNIWVARCSKKIANKFANALKAFDETLKEITQGSAHI